MMAESEKKSTRAEERAKRYLKKCYTMIDSIEKGSKMKKSYYVDEFKKYFEIVKELEFKKEDVQVLFKRDVLDDEFYGYSETISEIDDKSAPKIKINGETLLFRVVSLYNEGRTNDKLSERSSEKTNVMKLTNSAELTISARNTMAHVDKDTDDYFWDIIQYLVRNKPNMIIFGKKSENQDGKGYSPFYLAIVKKQKNVLRLMIDILNDQRSELDIAVDDVLRRVPLAEGYHFGDSVMLASTPLGVAALTLDKNIFRVVQKLYKDTQLNVSIMKNSKEDTIIHSLIKYIHKHQDQLEQGKRMLSYILEEDSWKYTTRPGELIKGLVTSKNREHLTPLQLAAKRQQFDLFEIILHNKNYCIASSNDALTLQEEYDITELETVPLKENENKSSDEHTQKINHFSVLEFVHLQPMQVAFHFADCRPVRKVIKEKWYWYRYIFYTCFFIHLGFMSILSWTAVERSSQQDQVANGSNPVGDIPSRSFGLSLFSFIVGICFILLHTTSRYIVHNCDICYKRFSARIKTRTVPNIWRIISILPYTNHMFEFFFFLFASLLVVDFIWAVNDESYSNYCLVFAVIIGWYLVLFYLQVFRRFSFFTVLIQRVLKDMFDFAIVMGFLLIGFSLAMFMAMQGATTEDDSYTSFWKTLVKMFTVMLGIGEIGDIFGAKKPTLAVIVFVIFVLLTTILLLNALIALMSNSCTELMTKDRGMISVNKMHEILQKLSVIIVLESCLPDFLLHAAGENKNNRRILDMRHTDIKEDIETDMDSYSLALNYIQRLVKSLHSKKRKKSRKNKRKNVVSGVDSNNETFRRISTLGTLEIIHALQGPEVAT